MKEPTKNILLLTDNSSNAIAFENLFVYMKLEDIVKNTSLSDNYEFIVLYVNVLTEEHLSLLSALDCKLSILYKHSVLDEDYIHNHQSENHQFKYIKHDNPKQFLQSIFKDWVIINSELKVIKNRIKELDEHITQVINDKKMLEQMVTELSIANLNIVENNWKKD